MRAAEQVRVLVAEDDFLVRETINGTLAELGYEVVGNAKNGLMAVEQACSLKPDVILMDVMMPVMNGLEAASQILAKCPTAIIMLTAYDSTPLLENACEAGVCAYLVKPPKAPEIHRAIKTSIARFRDYLKMKQDMDALMDNIKRRKILQGLIPICAYCKRIRDEKGDWKQMELYIHERSEAEFSHSMCPECARRVNEEIDRLENDRE